MGLTLKKPNTIKNTSEGSDKNVLYGSSCMQGWRSSMEDAHTTITSYDDTGASFFAVFDGHGGSKVANYSEKELHKKIMRSPWFDPNFKDYDSGCTAVVALMTRDHMLYVSNVGDSRSVISTRSGRGIPMTQDHKPKQLNEQSRINNAGGFVENGRVNGHLALSRALGDFNFKSNTQLTPDRQAVTAEPDIIEHQVTDQDEFMVLACDGVWDCLNSQEVIDFVRFKLADQKTLGTICEELMDFCLAESDNYQGIGCDNMTVIIVAFLRKRTPKAWYEWMASKPLPNMPKRKTILMK